MAQKAINGDWYDQYQEAANHPWGQTKLSFAEELKFRQEIKELPWFRDIARRAAAKGEKISDDELLDDMTGPNSDYDLRGAWKAGLKPKFYEYDGTYHWESSTPDGRMLKAPNHPTAWMEYFMRETGKDPNYLGLRNAEEARDYTRNANTKSKGKRK